MDKYIEKLIMDIEERELVKNMEEEERHRIIQKLVLEDHTPWIVNCLCSIITCK